MLEEWRLDGDEGEWAPVEAGGVEMSIAIVTM